MISLGAVAALPVAGAVGSPKPIALLDRVVADAAMRTRADVAALRHYAATAIARIEAETHLKLEPVDLSVTRMYTGGYIILPHGPVTAVSSVTIDGRQATHRANPDSRIVYTSGADGMTTVYYRAGFEALPDDLYEAILATVAAMARARSGHSDGRSISDAEPWESGQAWPASVWRTIQAWRLAGAA